MNRAEFYAISQDPMPENLLDQVVIALAEEDAAALSRLIGRYPNYAVSILDLLLGSSILEAPLSSEGLEYATSILSPEYEARMLRALIGDSEPVYPLPIRGIIARAEEIGLTLDDLAEMVDLPEEMLITLDQRITLRGVPQQCWDRLANALHVSTGAIEGFLANRLPNGAPAFSFASAPPPTTSDRTFYDTLLESPTVRPEQVAAWAAFLTKEWLPLGSARVR